MEASADEQAAVLALTEASPGEWYRTATAIHEAGSALALLDGQFGLMTEALRGHAETLIARMKPDGVERARALIDRALARGLRLHTVLDDDYPENLLLVYNRPPFIWTRGQLLPSDFRAIAVVGTRQASDDGRRRAAKIASDLAREGVTVLSGLARGIDTAAHTAALDVRGRTVAVVGHGLFAPVYPAENRGLAERIASSGVLVSQFWPDAPPRSMNFPMRNVVMSGLAMGTVVIEASSTSGAKMQARLALEHGKRLFLAESLLEQQEWARRYAARPGVVIVSSIDDILDVLIEVANTPEQLTLKL